MTVLYKTMDIGQNGLRITTKNHSLSHARREGISLSVVLMAILCVKMQQLSYKVCCILHNIPCNSYNKICTTVIERPVKIINKAYNITTNTGLPVTLTCYVEGDPNHYWVGWISRHSIIQAGEEHSISTSPNFKSTNGTIHHLTIHSVKEAGKYECKVYTIAGDVQDQVTHYVSVTDHDGKEHYTLTIHVLNSTNFC